MKKIMFNDKHGLTKAVLEGRKTMTRRVITGCKSDTLPYGGIDATQHFVFSTNDGVFKSAYKIGEVVAVAQSYKSVFEESLSYALPRYHWLDDHIDEKGFENKMFVKASEIPHRIRITDIKVERLQDISEENALCEGVFFFICGIDYGFTVHGMREKYGTAREAFAHLIDKVSGKGTWERNPWVFAYSFELID